MCKASNSRWVLLSDDRLWEINHNCYASTHYKMPFIISTLFFLCIIHCHLTWTDTSKRGSSIYLKKLQKTRAKNNWWPHCHYLQTILVQIKMFVLNKSAHILSLILYFWVLLWSALAWINNCVIRGCYLYDLFCIPIALWIERVQIL